MLPLSVMVMVFGLVAALGAAVQLGRSPGAAAKPQLRAYASHAS